MINSLYFAARRPRATPWPSDGKPPGWSRGYRNYRTPDKQTKAAAREADVQRHRRLASKEPFTWKQLLDYLNHAFLEELDIQQDGLGGYAISGSGSRQWTTSSGTDRLPYQIRVPLSEQVLEEELEELLKHLQMDAEELRNAVEAYHV